MKLALRLTTMSLTMMLPLAVFFGTANAADTFKLLHIPQVVNLQKDGAQVHIYDANTEEVRAKDGLIPGAVPLSSSSDYNVARTLPPNKDATLVFYCANEKCTASHRAAERAAKAGYKDVNVLPEGIQGWKKAGKPVTEYSKAGGKRAG